jgi:hypothetical protein
VPLQAGHRFSFGFATRDFIRKPFTPALHFCDAFRLLKRSCAACSSAPGIFAYLRAALETSTGSFALISGGSYNRIDFAQIRSSRARLLLNSIS